MPRLRINSKSKSTPARAHRHVGIPSSPFQKIIEQARIRAKMSTRELSRCINTRVGPKLHVNQSTVWFWMNSEAGYPSPRSFKPSHLRAMAGALELRETDIRAALDEARAIYSSVPAPAPRPQIDALATLELTVKNTTGQRVDRKWILHLIKSLRAQAESVQTVVPRAKK
jgi:hypothetical protein